MRTLGTMSDNHATRPSRKWDPEARGRSTGEQTADAGATDENQTYVPLEGHLRGRPASTRLSSVHDFGIGLVGPADGLASNGGPTSASTSTGTASS